MRGEIRQKRELRVEKTKNKVELFNSRRFSWFRPLMYSLHFDTCTSVFKMLLLVHIPQALSRQRLPLRSRHLISLVMAKSMRWINVDVVIVNYVSTRKRQNFHTPDFASLSEESKEGLLYPSRGVSDLMLLLVHLR